MGAKDEYIALNLWETHTDEHGNFRPARFLLENEEEEILENVEK
ncbi:hypothetical protein TSIB_1145 [Thermococcus sibiricus MM 739]|uniref:Uncharacterized protein n=2 Tax=Thermococcus sibiricus TaxID=172049 RepID=C6A3K4_THESM|nr:hypothetical protein TSIB_1145 [Thermococcus sibiricus MM 739]